MKLSTTLALAALGVTSTLAHAQFAVDWFTIDGGGGTLAGGTFAVTGTTGQPDAGVLIGGSFQVSAGFWVGAGASCYANCDESSVAPILNVNDFQCFLNKFAQESPAANCDQSTVPPVLNVNDFQCFVNKFAMGCP